MKLTRKWLVLLGACFGTTVLSAGVAHADAFVNPTGPAEGACLAEGTGGIANGCFGPTFAISGTGTAGANSCWKTALAISVLGSACAAPDGNVLGVPVSGVAISGSAPATSDSVAISATGTASAPVAVSPVATTFAVAGWPPCDKDHKWSTRTDPATGKLYQCTPIYGTPGDDDSAVFIWLPVF